MTADPCRDDDRAVDRYLEVLFGRARSSTLIDVRWRVPDGMGQRFLPASDRAALPRLVARVAPRTDVYLGVLPHWRRAGDRGAVVGDCRTVWVDLDTDVAARALEPVDPGPALVIASGGPGHLHAYWQLRTAVPPGMIERANRRLAWAIGADLSSVDAARILRPPSTINHLRDGTPVQLIAAGSQEPCRLSDLVGGLPDPPPTRCGHEARREDRRAAGDRLLALEPERYVLALTGRRVGRSRKIHCPLHEDWIPSFHVYEDPARGWYCFGCRRGGTVYDLAGALWHRPTKGAGFTGLRAELERLLLTDHSSSHEPDGAASAPC